MGLVDRINRRPQPRNDGSVRIARSALDQITPMAVQQHMNAIAVDGIPCLYFIRKSSGVPCTCTGLQPQTNPDGTNANVMPTTPGSHTVQPQGFGSDEYMASVLEGTSYRINRYGSRPRHVDANGDDNKWRADPRGRFSNDGVIRAADLADPYARQVDTVDTDDLFDVGASQNVSASTEQTSCAVCLGTGFVGGYDPVNGNRVVYDAQADWRGTTVNGAAKPNELVAGNQARLSLTIPMGARHLIALKVWNNKDQVSGVTINYAAGDSFKQLTPDLAGVTKGVPVQLQLLFSGSSQTFTHLEVMYDMGLEPVLLGWNRMSFSEDFNKIDQLDDVSVVLPPNIPITSLYDIVTEPVYKRAWKVTNTSNGMDRNLKVNGSEAQVRVLQPFELANLLPVLTGAQYYRYEQIVQRRRPTPGEGRMPSPYSVEQTKPGY